MLLKLLVILLGVLVRASRRITLGPQSPVADIVPALLEARLRQVIRLADLLIEVVGRLLIQTALHQEVHPRLLSSLHLVRRTLHQAVQDVGTRLAHRPVAAALLATRLLCLISPLIHIQQITETADHECLIDRRRRPALIQAVEVLADLRVALGQILRAVRGTGYKSHRIRMIVTALVLTGQIVTPARRCLAVQPLTRRQEKALSQGHQRLLSVVVELLAVLQRHASIHTIKDLRQHVLRGTRDVEDHDRIAEELLLLGLLKGCKRLPVVGELAVAEAPQRLQALLTLLHAIEGVAARPLLRQIDRIDRQPLHHRVNQHLLLLQGPHVEPLVLRDDDLRAGVRGRLTALVARNAIRIRLHEPGQGASLGLETHRHLRRVVG